MINKEELISYIDELHHNRESYSKAKLLELIKEKLYSKVVVCPVCMTSDVTFSHDKVVNLKSDDIHLKVYTCNHCQRNFSN